VIETRLPALGAFDPLGYLAALGLLRIIDRYRPRAQLRWLENGTWSAELVTEQSVDVVDVLNADVERWRAGHPALDFAMGAERKIQDLKHQPGEFRTLMRNLVNHGEAAEFVAAYATGVAKDGSGQTKPTSFHMTAGQQRFMDVILSLRAEVTREDLREAIEGPWVGRTGPKDPRWQAASERSRALLWFDPSKEPFRSIVGAAWLAFNALPLFPVVPVGLRAVTTGFSGRGKSEQFTWPVWRPPLTLADVRVLVGLRGLAEMNPADRTARGIALILRADVLRSNQGYGNFSPAALV
jgi:hypothetical protein